MAMEVDAPEAAAAPPEQPAGKRRLILRLDDGSLLGPGSLLDAPTRADQPLVRISVERASELGRADKAVAHLEGVLERLKAQGYEPKPSAQDVMAHEVMASKRSRSHVEPLTRSSVQVPPGHEWVLKCSDVLRKVTKDLGDHAGMYFNVVSPAAFPDYYKVIVDENQQTPVFLSEVKSRLDNGEYTGPQEFAADMRQHWYNVRLYNPVGDFYRGLGEKVEEKFENYWAGTGYASGAERLRRTTAGMNPNKFVPDERELVKPARSRQTASKSKERRGAAEVSSGRPGPLSEERRREIAETLQNLPDELADPLMGLLPQELLNGIETGELELDFEALDEETLQRIDAWLRELYPHAPVAQPAVVTRQPERSGRPSASMRVDTYSDEDYEAEESDSED